MIVVFRSKLVFEHPWKRIPRNPFDFKGGGKLGLTTFNLETPGNGNLGRGMSREIAYITYDMPSPVHLG